MSFFADLHIHSKHSRATSRDCDLEHLGWWASRKGISVIGTGDFTHPGWFAELQDKLVADGESGLFRLRDDLERERLKRLPTSCRSPVRFMLSVEISTIYKRGERTRKIHHLVYAPDFATAERFNQKLGRLGNLASDGRPILGLDSRHLLEVTLESGPGAYLVPAHIWTPWFAVLGAMSGFDAVADCYADLADHVFAVETGLSSDPPMNWRVSSLDRYRLVSSSDAHSPPVLGREACVFACDIDYFAMRRALETGQGYGGTVEFFPEEGKYHLDGHRKCNVRLEPEETRARDGACPACGKRVTVGVMSRVDSLADRTDGTPPASAAPFRCLVPLAEVLGEISGVGAKSKTVERNATALVERLGPELGILSSLPIEEIRRASGSSLIEEAIARLRRGDVIREAGYDGEYGVIRMFREDELRSRPTIGSLFALDGRDGCSGELSAEPTEPTRTRSQWIGPERPLARDFVEADHAGAAPSRQAVAEHDRSPILAGLDAEQRAAAAIVDGPLLVIAGPGSGKTRTCTHRIAHLIAERGAAPEQCLAITFTRRAAEEMRARLAALLPREAPRIEVTTFHGLGMRIVQEERVRLGFHRGLRIASEEERIALVRELAACSAKRASRLLAQMSRCRRTGEEEESLVPGYREAMWERDLLDFDDLIELPVELLERDPQLVQSYRARFRWISVDEYQDVDEKQYRLVRFLAPPDASLCAIGDPDQAIYGFRGADVGFFLRFREDYPRARIVELRRNYRSSATIVAGALQAIAPASLVPGRGLAPAGAKHEERQILLHEAPTERAEAQHVVHSIERLLGGYSYFSIDSGRVDSGTGEHLSFADIAVLFRTEAQAMPIEEALERAGIPFQRRSHARLLDRPGVREIAERLRKETASPEIGLFGAAGPATVRQRIAAFGDGEGEPSRDAELLEPLAKRHGTDVEGFLRDLALGAEIDTWDPRADRLSLLTLHAAKGLEFAVVFLVGCEDGFLPLRFGQASTNEDEERRLFFVGMTRARSHLFLSWARKRVLRGEPRVTELSPFIGDIAPELLARQRAEYKARRTAAASGEQLTLL